MNFITQHNRLFDLFVTRPISADCICLYWVLLNLCNKSGWEPTLNVPNKRLESFCGFSRERLVRARQELCDLGIIQYTAPKGRGFGSYSIVNLENFHQTKNDRNHTQSQTQSSAPSNNSSPKKPPQNQQINDENDENEDENDDESDEYINDESDDENENDEYINDENDEYISDENDDEYINDENDEYINYESDEYINYEYINDDDEFMEFEDEYLARGFLYECPEGGLCSSFETPIDQEWDAYKDSFVPPPLQNDDFDYSKLHFNDPPLAPFQSPTKPKTTHQNTHQNTHQTTHQTTPQTTPQTTHQPQRKEKNQKKRNILYTNKTKAKQNEGVKARPHAKARFAISKNNSSKSLESNSSKSLENCKPLKHNSKSLESNSSKALENNSSKALESNPIKSLEGGLGKKGVKNSKGTHQGYKSDKTFVAPSFEEVEAYCKEKEFKVEARKFFDYYEAMGWVDARGQEVRSWKGKLVAWNNREPNQPTNRPTQYQQPSQKPKEIPSPSRDYTNEEINAMFDKLRPEDI